MKFCWSTLYVKDLDESIKFYQEIIGLKVVDRFQAGPQTQIAFLGEGTLIELIESKEKTGIDVGRDISWGFEVDSVDKMIRFLQERGIPLASEIMQPNSTSKFFFIKDPNGMRIQIYERVEG